METLGFRVQRRVAQPEPPAAPPPTLLSTATVYMLRSLLDSLAIVAFLNQLRPSSPVDVVYMNDSRHRE